MKHTIDIQGLPEGFEAKEVLLIECESNDNDQRVYGAQVIVKKKQPRRIVLEETDEENHLYESGQYASFSAGEFVITGTKNKWRIVEDSEEKNDD